MRTRQQGAIRQKVDVLVVGSSVAAGSDARRGRGWAALLAASLMSEHRLSLVNKAIGGYDTQSTMGLLRHALGIYEPRVVIIGLSLANEGLPWAENRAAADAVASQFEAGLRALAEVAVAAGCKVRARRDGQSVVCAVRACSDTGGAWLGLAH